MTIKGNEAFILIYMMMICFSIVGSVFGLFIEDNAILFVSSFSLFVSTLGFWVSMARMFIREEF